ncbi:leucyl/phenylalanyl-tRNA--protein transferase [Mariniluteicoccus endophyticus]
MTTFGPPEDWPADDLIGWSREVDPMMVVEAYASGVFPMPVEDVMGWWSPLRRGILPLDGLKVSRSLRKTAKRYRITVDQAFGQVIDRCADPARDGFWIDGTIRALYRSLHAGGIAHSVEAWDAEGRLVGGLYGVAIGGLFAGESMFHDTVHGRDASKAALIGLVDVLRAAGDIDRRLLDVQWQTDHLATLGVVEVPRSAYLARLEQALELCVPRFGQD